MDQWINGWMDDWMNGWMGRTTSQRREINKRTNGPMDVSVNQWVNGRMDARINGWMVGWMESIDEWMKSNLHSSGMMADGASVVVVVVVEVLVLLVRDLRAADPAVTKTKSTKTAAANSRLTIVGPNQWTSPPPNRKKKQLQYSTGQDQSMDREFHWCCSLGASDAHPTANGAYWWIFIAFRRCLWARSVRLCHGAPDFLIGFRRNPQNHNAKFRRDHTKSKRVSPSS